MFIASAYTKCAFCLCFIYKDLRIYILVAKFIDLKLSHFSKLKTQLIYHIIVFSLIAFIANSQQYRFRPFSTKQGFPSKDVNLAIQDYKGFMWFGTYKGVLRYDGTDFHQYIYKIDDTTSIGDNNISEIYEDSNKDIYIGGESFLCKYNKEQDNFIRFNTKHLQGTFVNAIVESNTNTLYLATYNGLFIIDRQKHELSELSVQLPIWDMWIKDSLLFLGTQYNGLIIMSTNTNKIIKRINHQNTPKYSESTSIIYDFAEDQQGNVWFSGSHGGLYSITIPMFSLKKHEVIINNKPSKENLHTLYIGHDNEIITAFINNGIAILNPKTKNWTHYTSAKPEKLSITSNSIRDIYEDKNGTVWFSTHFGGVCYYNIRDNAIKYYYRQVTDKHSIGHDIVSSFIEDKNRSLWIATDGGGLYLQKHNNHFEPFNSEHGLNTNAITDIEKDASGYLWISEWLGGVQSIDPVHKNIVNSFLYNKDSSINFGSEVKGIFCDSYNRLWIFSHFRPLSIYDITNNRTYTKKSPGTYPPALFDIKYSISGTEDTLGNIWISSSDGLYKYSDPVSVKFYSTTLGDTNSLISTPANHVYCDSKNNVWVLTPEALELYNATTDGFINISQTYNFPKLFYSIIEDDNKLLWFTSPQGIGYFNSESYSITFFDRNLPISGDDYISRSGYKKQNGHILFGSTNGFIELDPNLLYTDTSSFNIEITDIQLFNKSIDHHIQNSILQKSILQTDSITLHHMHNVFSIKYSSLYYIGQDQISYAYRLVGFDENWNYVNQEKKATYTNLPAGEYRFEVKAQNIEGIWSTPRILHISVLPPWWNTWWFRSLYISALICTIIIIFLNRINYQKRLNKRLAELVDIRTNELKTANKDLERKNKELRSQNDIINSQKKQLDELNKTKDKFFSIVAHDLKNPMHSLIGFTDLLLTKYANLKEEKKLIFIKTINKSSKHLYELMVNLLDWSRAQSRSLQVTPDLVFLSEIVTETILPLRSNINEKNITLHINIPNDITAYIDPNMLETVIRNLLSNAIKFSNKGGNIYINSLLGNDYVELSIKDEGVGIPEKKLKNLFTIGKIRSSTGTEQEKGTGLGLILSKEFIELNNGSITAHSTEKGTEFIIKIPSAM